VSGGVGGGSGGGGGLSSVAGGCMVMPSISKRVSSVVVMA
jgi:hypothetical protein